MPRKKREERDLRRMLRNDLPEPASELVESIELRLKASGPRRRFSARAALAAGLTTVLAVGFAAVGGADYATAAAAKAGLAVKSAASSSNAVKENAEKSAPAPNARKSSSASHDQYGPERTTICHRTPSGTARTLVLPVAAANAHLAQHRGRNGAGPDSLGACR